MTLLVSDLAPLAQYEASAAQVDFSVPFLFLNDEDVVILVDGVEATLATDYTLAGSGVETGGTATFLSGMAGGEIITVYLEMPLERRTEFSISGDFKPDALNLDSIRLLLMIQEWSVKIARVLRQPITDAATMADLPAKADRAGKYVAFDANGDPVPSAGTGTDNTLRTELAAATSPGGAALVGLYDPSGFFPNDDLQAALMRLVIPVATYDDLLLITGAFDGQRVDLTSYYTSATPDGGSGPFKWSSTSTATHNGGTVIKPTAVSGAGRWLRLAATIFADQFGASPSISDNGPFINAAIVATGNIGAVGFAQGADYPHTTTITVPTTQTALTLFGNGKTRLLYTGSGTALSSPGSIGARLSFLFLSSIELKNNVARPGSRGTAKGLVATYTDIIVLDKAQLSGFSVGISLNNSTGFKSYGSRLYDNTTGVDIQDGSGGFDWLGGTWDSNQLAMLISGQSSGISVHGVECDTDLSGYNGANSNGAVSVTAASSEIDFYSCRFLAEAVPTLGATISLSGGCRNVNFYDPHFEGLSHSQAAIKFDTVTGAKVIGGSTTLHTASSYIQTSSASNVMVLEPSNGEATRFTGTGSANPAILTTTAFGQFLASATGLAADGGLVARSGSPVQLNSADNSANVQFSYSGGYAYTPGDVNLAGAAKIGGAGKGLSFYGGAPSAKQVVTGAKGGNAALTSLLAALAAYGIVTDSTT